MNVNDAAEENNLIVINFQQGRIDAAMALELMRDLSARIRSCNIAKTVTHIAPIVDANILRLKVLCKSRARLGCGSRPESPRDRIGA